MRDVESGAAVGAPIKPLKGLTGATFSHDGRFVVTSGGFMARVWDAATGQPVSPPLSHQGTVTHAEFSPDGARVVIASYDHTARVWDAQTGQPLGSAMQHQRPIVWAGPSPDGRRVVTAGQDRTSIVWSVGGDDAVKLWEPPQGGQVERASFRPDGPKVLTSGSTVVVWDAATGKQTCTNTESAGYIWHAQFNRDATRFVTADGDNYARVWDARTGAPVGPGVRLTD